MTGAGDRPKAEHACVFCRVVRGEAPARVVFEDEVVLAFLDHRPLLPGHCLLVPKAHHKTLADLPAALLGPLFAATQGLARVVEAGMGSDGSFVAVNNRVSQSVPHVHVHVVPRWRTDGLFGHNFVWVRHPYESEAAAEAAQAAIRGALPRRPAG